MSRPPAALVVAAPTGHHRPAAGPSRPRWAARLAEPAPLAALVVLTAVAQPHLLASQTLVSLDSASQFYPWYAYLGQGLRAGHVPGWNPAVFSGTPFAANPLSGWTYLPAMLLFTIWPLAQAARLYLVFHPLLAAGGAYALARALRLHPAGALLAGLAYANTGYFQVQNACCFAFASVYAWLPLALLGVEMALRAARWSARIAWWGAAGLALSQILAAWLGQGAYYACLLVGGYLVYRTLVVPPEGGPGGGPARVARLLQHGGGVFAAGAALAAAGLLPRLEFNALSNLAGGYTGAEASVGGLHPKDWGLPATPGFWYAGASVLALALLAPVLARRPVARLLWYFAATSLGALLLTGTTETPLHWLLYHLLPGFARLHPHAPERILTVAYLGPAIMAGATVDAVWRRRPWPVPPGLAGSPRRRALAAGLSVLVVAADLALGGGKARADYTLTDPLNGIEKLTPVDLSTYYRPNGVARFLQQRLGEGPFRYVGYAPEIDGRPIPYSTRFLDPGTAALGVDNRALTLGLQDVQGYDASHLARYDAYLVALDGRSQNYHDAEVFREGLGSPLLDLLDARYVVVPTPDRLDGFDQAALARFPDVAFEDGQTRILGNPSALPRAWLVHAARQVGRGEALAALGRGEVDPRRTALLEEPPPPLAQPTDPAHDAATVAVDDADRLSLRATTDAPGLLVLSEVYYPAWHAYVDGQPAPLYLADQTLRAVPVPPGDHTVELRFESATLAIGSAISGLALLLLVGLVGLAALRAPARRRRGSGDHGVDVWAQGQGSVDLEHGALVQQPVRGG